MDITIKLSTANWNVVMNALGGRPYMEVVELINEIKAQADKQLNAAKIEEEITSRQFS